MMRVAVMGSYPEDTSRIPGGIAAVVYYLVQGLRKYPDMELHVIAPSKESDADRTVRDGNVTIHYMSIPRRHLIPNQFVMVKRMVELFAKIKPDLVHGHLPTGVAAGLEGGYPTIYTIHGIKHREIRYERTLSGKLAAWLEARIAKRCVGRAKHCIANAEYARQAYEKYTKAKWHFVYNAIEDRFFDIQSNEVPDKMLSAGLIYERKNTLGLVRAFDLIHQQCPECSLYVCGKVIQPDYFAQVQDFVKTHGLEETCHLLGFISQDELERHFREASIICLFSKEETAPMVLAQAMCAGKCVVASRAGGTPDMVIDGETGYLVDVGDEEAFAKKSLELLGNSELRQRMGRRAREVAEERFRADKVAAKTLEVYREVLAEQGPKTL
jgi:glycosyltransferase involved in cell wall biosynthesis